MNSKLGPQQPTEAKGTKALLKSTAAFGSVTVVSRITGLIRDIIFAQIIGSTIVADAFFVAFRIPNFFRRIFGEGAFSAAFIPVYTQKKMSAPAAEVRGFLDLVSGRLALALLTLTLIGVIFAPILVSALAPGFRADPIKFQMTVDSLRITFPYVFFICLVALCGAILNTHERFAAPAATPILLNVALIAAALWITGLTENAAVALSIGVFVAGVVQLLFQIPFLARINTVPRPRLKRKQKGEAEEGAKEVYRLMLPSIFGSSVAQINLIINTFIASFLVTGSVSWLYYSDRLMEFPLGVFGVALGSVILPRLSKEHAQVASAEFSRLLDWGLRLSLLISIPATVGLIALSDIIMATLFFHGAFTENDVAMSSRALIAFSVGLVALVAVRVLSPGFFARNDTKTPVRAGVIAMFVNIGLAIVLVFPLKHVGLALAISVSAFVNAGLLLYWLIREKTYSPQLGWLVFLARTIGASLIMGGTLVWLTPTLTEWFEIGIQGRIFWLFLYIFTGAVLYSVWLVIFGMKIRQFVNQ